MEAFLANERKRKRKAYKSVLELSKRVLKKRKAGSERKRKSYYKRKESKAKEAAGNL